jgi:hypothetical protein
MSRGARAGKVTVYGQMGSRASNPTSLLEVALEYCTSTAGATVAGPPAPYDVEIAVVTVALVEEHSAQKESLYALAFFFLPFFWGGGDVESWSYSGRGLDTKTFGVGEKPSDCIGNGRQVMREIDHITHCSCLAVDRTEV